MKKRLLCVSGLLTLASFTLAGTETYSGKEMKTTMAPPPCPQWYADYEWNVDLWGTYAFTDNKWIDDRYLETDHAWGGGIDAKYFFMRYFGVGIEGWAVDARQTREHIAIDFSDGTFDRAIGHVRNAVGSVLGTLTLRYPIPCTRFAPYVFAGGGGIFGGGQKPHFIRVAETGEGLDILQTSGFSDSESKGIGQFGGGIEVRITPHIGWMADFSWNVIDGPENNFGMVRSGVNFAF
jgi:Outer membrane protein beta-barrel domain